jgi:hypothetical protein
MTGQKRNVEPKQDLPAAWWAMNLDEIDREIARLALLCRVRILDPGVVERVLKKDASVCGTDNPVAFAKLHDMVMMHLAIREKSAASVGQGPTVAIEKQIVERLSKSFPDLAAPWPSA